MQVRNLRPGDALPTEQLSRDNLPFGLDNLPLDCEWTWVAIRDAQIIGILCAAPVLGLLWLLRISVTPDSPPAAPMLLLRRAFRDARRRGLLGYVTFLSDSAAAESKLMRIVQRAQGNLLPASGAWAFGTFNETERHVQSGTRRRPQLQPAASLDERTL